MTNVFEQKEAEAVQAIAARYRSRGYDVSVYPKLKALPEQLRRFRPDLVARNASENIIVEVKSKASLRRASNLKPLAQRIKSMPGWRFELIITNPEIESSVPTEGESLSITDIRKRLAESKALLSSGHVSAGFLLAWSAAEAALRRLASENGLDTSGYGPTALYKELYSIGLLPRRVYEVFAKAVQTRNSLVHGFKLAENGQVSTIDRLVSAIDRVLREMNSSMRTIRPESGRRGRRTSGG